MSCTSSRERSAPKTRHHLKRARGQRFDGVAGYGFPCAFAVPLVGLSVATGGALLAGWGEWRGWKERRIARERERIARPIIRRREAAIAELQRRVLEQSPKAEGARSLEKGSEVFLPDQDAIRRAKELRDIDEDPRSKIIAWVKKFRDGLVFLHREQPSE
jgi:hypothetical protein